MGIFLCCPAGGKERERQRFDHCYRAFALVFLLLLVGHSGAAGAQAADADTVAAVRAELARSVAAWNRGDIRGFMDSYWHSDRLRFASGNTVTRGWQATLERYLARYGDDRASMGELRFSGLEIDPLGEDAAVVFGHYHLERAGGVSEGLFTLVWRRIDGAWRIVADHTSTAAD
ncbi:MAG: YybH family protein [Rhodothalassiaceae bacterium]